MPGVALPELELDDALLDVDPPVPLLLDDPPPLPLDAPEELEPLLDMLVEPPPVAPPPEPPEPPDSPLSHASARQAPSRAVVEYAKSFTRRGAFIIASRYRRATRTVNSTLHELARNPREQVLDRRAPRWSFRSRAV